MKFTFFKYEGAGNDFVILDNRDLKIDLNQKAIERLCDRRFGIGADGLILLEKDKQSDFKMVYFNSDGKPSSFCGNGGRCIAHFAFHVLKIVGREMNFSAFDGIHHASILNNEEISLSMQPVKEISFFETFTQLDTGSPHYVKSVKNLKDYPVFKEGRKVRNSPPFSEKGINVNFVETKDGENYLRTYERGVEAETFACGTGITATAIALAGKAVGHFSVALIAKAGHHFRVDFDKKTASSAGNIILTGPVNCVFVGEMGIEDTKDI